ncbi:N-acetylmuramidase domain-containing protein [Burkholderia sp. AU28942]|uniref:N-acetylmuramidase domain-containing protein n=1 Tax=Burkholderia TaxID=32008 RepID=UPI00084137BF|nr:MULTISPECIES: N-acetylmuramidase domain-containing protein [Burkholderia]AOK03298.1 peptidoglycan-binding protein [Burkholderia latens]MCA8312323.1 N-acetylmuramidase domain-containing protein [Burkholderia sp. AU28942]
MYKTLRLGDRGADVSYLQRQLIAAGARLDTDAIYGSATRNAVVAFQATHGLVADGIAGPKTRSTLSAGRRDPRHLTDADLQRAADRLQVDIAAVRAVNEVESKGAGFLPDGRPVILYERHIMYRQLAAAGLDADALAAKYPALVNPKRGGYAGDAAEYARLASASQISAACALEATSWGAFQIMGFHWKALGYPDVFAFVDAMKVSEAEQLEAFVRFVLADKVMLAALRGKKWAKFAELYNGKAYAEHLYDVKLERAFDRYSRAAA